MPGVRSGRADGLFTARRLKIARKKPSKSRWFFLALGLRPPRLRQPLTVLQAAKDNVKNFSVFCNHITIVPALKALLDSPDLQLDGFLGPGHVSTVIGTRPYDFVRASTQAGGRLRL